MDITLGSYLKEKIVENGLSSRKFAIKCNITPAYISDIEKGKRIPSRELLDRFVSELKLTDEEANMLFDLAVNNYENRVSYDLVDYIMNTPYLRACIRKSMKVYDDSFWESLYNELDSGV